MPSSEAASPMAAGGPAPAGARGRAAAASGVALVTPPKGPCLLADLQRLCDETAEEVEQLRQGVGLLHDPWVTGQYLAHRPRRKKRGLVRRH